MYAIRSYYDKVRGELELRVQDKLKQLNSVFVAVSELLITDANSLVFDTFPNSETYKSNYILADEIEETDEVFWQNYNIIKPDSQLESVFK